MKWNTGTHNDTFLMNFKSPIFTLKNTIKTLFELFHLQMNAFAIPHDLTSIYFTIHANTWTSCPQLTAIRCYE